MNNGEEKLSIKTTTKKIKQNPTKRRRRKERLSHRVEMGMRKKKKKNITARSTMD